MAGGSGGEGGHDFDLNLAPIIDCFTVLITYLLVSASFLSLTVFDAGVAVSGPAAEGAAEKNPPLVIVVELKESRQLEIQAAGGAANVNLKIPVGAVRGAWDFFGAEKKLRELGAKYALPKELTLTAEPAVQYKDMIRAIEALRRVIPKVLMAG